VGSCTSSQPETGDALAASLGGPRERYIMRQEGNTVLNQHFQHSLHKTVGRKQRPNGWWRERYIMRQEGNTVLNQHFQHSLHKTVGRKQRPNGWWRERYIIRQEGNTVLNQHFQHSLHQFATRSVAALRTNPNSEPAPTRPVAYLQGKPPTQPCDHDHTTGSKPVQVDIALSTVVASIHKEMLGPPRCRDKARAAGNTPVRGPAIQLSPLHCGRQHPGRDAGTATLP
jgi:hypothetical protein